jgi:hypothetical protein
MGSEAFLAGTDSPKELDQYKLSESGYLDSLRILLISKD